MRTKSLSIAALFIACLFASGSEAAEVASVKLPDSVTVAGTPLVLNGAGLRTKLMLKIYVVGLYLPTKTSSAEAIIQSKEPRRAHLVMKRNLGAATVWDAFAEGIEINSTPAELAAIQGELAQIEKLFNDLGEVKEGDAIDIDFAADGATNVSFKGQPKGSIPSPNLQRALLKIWLGAEPVQEDLKKALLGGG